MKIKAIGIAVGIAIFFISCAKNVEYTSEFIDQTSGRYLYTPDEVLVVYYENNRLFLKWRGEERLKPLIIDQNTFFVADMYKKLRFAKHPDSNEFYLATVDANDDDLITYDYLKLADSVHIPSQHLLNGDFDKALAGYVAIKKQDSTSILINEREFNRLGYSYLRNEKHQNAIDVFKINAALYPGSSNVYDSLADAYLRSGDSLQAFINYEKALELDSDNRRAKEFVNTYRTKN